MRLLRGEVLTAAILVALFTFMVLYAFRFPAPARLLPWLAGLTGLLFSVVALVGELRKPGGQADEEQPEQLRRELQLFGWFGIFTGSMLLLGVLATTLVVVFLFLRFQQREPLKLSAAMAAGSTLVLYLVFELVLGLALFEGFVYDWITG